MARCPECQTEQSADFGMTTCSKCSAVFMIGIDGQVESAEAASYDEPVHQLDDQSDGQLADQSMDEASNEATTLQPYEPQANDFAETFPVTSDDAEVAEANEAEFEGEPAEEAADDVEYSENFLDNLSDSKTAEPPTLDPLDIQRFDESASSQMEDGEYVYEVVVSGIDSADLKKDVIMALSDKRFALVVSELQREIQKGELIVRNLNPVRAMLIVLRLQSLDVIVEWKQKHFTQEAGRKKSEAEI
jgi:hypothetical protein